MAKYNGSSLVFSEDDLKSYASTSRFLPKLIRQVFFRFQITNDDYINRYWETWSKMHHGATRKECHSQAGQNRNFIHERDKLTYKMLASVLRFMGYDITEVRITVMDRVTKETFQFSTNDSLEDIKEQIAKDREIGISALS